MKPSYIIGIIIASIALFVGVMFAPRWFKNEAQESGEGSIRFSQEKKNIEIMPPVIPPAGWAMYSDAERGFSLYYPPGVRMKEFRDGEEKTRTLTFEDEATQVGFQIFITKYPAEEISEARFLQDVPSGIRKNPKNIRIGGVPAVAFNSQDAALGETMEIWFLHDGYLFEITTLAPLGEWLSDVMKTWRFGRDVI